MMIFEHQPGFQDLGSAREVISRAIKKLEEEGSLQQKAQGWLQLNT